MTENRRLAAEVRWGNAQLAEKAAREGNNPAGIQKAKADQVAAMDEIARIDEETRTGSGEERVTLIGPNPYANLTDSNGVEFVNGRAEGVRRSLARKYTEDLDGYTIEGEDMTDQATLAQMRIDHRAKLREIEGYEDLTPEAKARRRREETQRFDKEYGAAMDRYREDLETKKAAEQRTLDAASHPCPSAEESSARLLRGSVNRRVANVTTVGQEAIQSFGELSGKESSQPIDGSS